MRRLLAALTLAALPAPPLAAGEPDICYAGEPPADAIATIYRLEGSPFAALDRTLSALYLPRALCGEDVAADKAFWRSFVASFGCSRDSEIAGLVDGWLDQAPAAAQTDFDAAREAQPDRVAALCAKVADCNVPERYDPEGNDGFYCRSLAE